jgi:hypothetical protein
MTSSEAAFLSKGGERAMRITVSRPINGISINGDECLLDESGELLEFETMRDALRFLAEHNFTLIDLSEFDFHFEEPEEAPHALTAMAGE